MHQDAATYSPGSSLLISNCWSLLQEDSHNSDTHPVDFSRHPTPSSAQSVAHSVGAIQRTQRSGRGRKPRRVKGYIYSCVYCGKSFNRASNMRQHEKIHENSRPFPCTICSRSFRHKHHLQRHIFNLHGQSPYDLAPTMATTTTTTTTSRSQAAGFSAKTTSTLIPEDEVIELNDLRVLIDEEDDDDDDNVILDGGEEETV